eukprot:gene5483-5718_t
MAQLPEVVEQQALGSRLVPPRQYRMCHAPLASVLQASRPAKAPDAGVGSSSSSPPTPATAPPDKPAHDVVAGAMARAASQSTIHPLDTMKVRMQAGSLKGSGAASSAASSGSMQLGASRPDSLTHSFQRGMSEVASLYKGVVSAATGAGIIIGAYFAFYSTSKRFLRERTDWKEGQVAFVSGATAAVGSGVVKVPIAVCIRSVQAGVYPNVVQAARSIVQAAGVRGLFTGFLPTLLEDVPDMAVKFAVYETLRPVHSRLTGNVLAEGEGTRAFFKGVGPRALSNGLNSAVFFCFFEAIRRNARRTVAARLSSTGIIPLGYDFLTFLTTTVLIVPVCKSLKLSPVLGFLFAGVVLEQIGMLKDLKDMETLSELGVLFLLYEQGLELSLDRLKAVVIAAALSMSSSAFVLQLLSERGEAPTRVGSATLGILLFQDIAVVPFLVLLPLIESHGGMEGASADTLLQMLGPTTATSLAGLGALLLGGRVVLRRFFEMVADSRSNEAFVALCLLTVGGSSLLTKQLGLSDTLGAFIAGVLLSETSFRTQVEADIRPFRGLLIGLFFMSVGGSINMAVLKDNYDIIFWMLLGLVSLKAAVNIMLGPLFGLSKAESIRTGFLLSQGGEFAFVLLSLACQLKLLPEELNQILIITVVFSMALTPALAEVGSRLADAVDAAEDSASDEEELPVVALEIDAVARVVGILQKVDDPVVILGFGPQGQMVANMLSSPLAQPSNRPRRYIGFDLDYARVYASRRAGFNVAFGNGSRPDVLKAADLGTSQTAISLLRRGIDEALAVRTAAYSSSSSMAAASTNGTDSGQKKQKKQIELFVLDGRHMYGLRAEALAKAMNDAEARHGWGDLAA